MIRVSVIIPSFNSFATIARTIESLLQQSSLQNIVEIIIVDSSNDTKTRDLFKKYVQPIVKVIALDQKTSPSEGRNLGAAKATGDLLCFIDSDVYLSSDWLKEILEAYHTGCRAGGGSVSAPDFQQNNQLALAQLYLQFNESLPIGSTRVVTMLPACNMFVDKNLFLKVGGFPNLRASEDVMLCLNIGKIDRVWFVPQAKCFHIFREETRSYYNNQMILGKYIIVYRRMVYGKWYYRGLWPILMLPAFLLIKISRITMRIYNSGNGHFGKFLKSFSLFLAGFYFWAVGFIQGCLEKESK